MVETSASESAGSESRCHAAKAPKDGPPLIQDGRIHLQSVSACYPTFLLIIEKAPAHHIGWMVTGVFTLIACLASFWLINKHLQWYRNKKEQRYIVRILFMVPLYAVISLASYLFWNHSTPLVLLRDCYEAFVMTAFFYLLLAYISPNLEEQKEVFLKVGLSRENDRKRVRRGEDPQKWVLPLGFVQSKPADGVYFLQMMKWGVLQYCVIRPLTTLAAVILDYAGLYCEESWSPGWGHIYLTVVMSLSVTVAMYCLIQLYVTIAEPLKPYSPLLKLFAIKAVVFLTFWQATFLAVLSMFGVVKDTEYMTAENINIGIGAIAECVEMTIFAFLHIKCFSYTVYLPDPATLQGGITDERTSRLRSLGHAMNFKETLRELWSGFVYMLRRMRGQETDKLIMRTVVMESAFGRPRIAAKDNKSRREKPDATTITVEVEETVHVGAERQWLGLGDDYGYGLSYVTREKSDGLGEQIEKELMQRGYGAPLREALDLDPEQGHSRGTRSWWRSIYDRLSQSGPDENLSTAPMRKSNFRPTSMDITNRVLMDRVYDDPPPASALRTYRSQRHVATTLNTALDNNPIAEYAPPILLTRSDSLLARVFPYGTSNSHSNSNSSEVLVPSSQSHQTRVHLNAAPEVVVNASVARRTSEMITMEVERPTRARVGEALSPPLYRILRRVEQHDRFQQNPSPNHLHSPQFSRLGDNRRSDPVVGTNSLLEREPHAQRFRPTRDQLRMPAPLAPVREFGNQPPPISAVDSRPAAQPHPRSSQPPGSHARNARRKPPPSFPVPPADLEVPPSSFDSTPAIYFLTSDPISPSPVSGSPHSHRY